MVGKRIDPCEQLVAERLDAIRGIRRTLVNPLEALFLLRKPTIDALEPLQDLGAHLLQPQHVLVACYGHARTKLPEEWPARAPVLQELTAARRRW